VISVVIPVLNEAALLPGTLARLRDSGPGCDVVVADGGSVDGSAEAAAAAGTCAVVRAPRGRARQMNAGARAARGDILLFLHADCRLGPGWPDAVDGAVRRHGRIGGCLTQSVDGEGRLFAAIGGLAMFRARVLRVYYGDQGIFVRRDVFDRLGGFREELPFLEDVELCRRLRRAGPLGIAPAGIRSSVRDWLRHGVFRTMVRNWGISLLYGAGVPAEELARWYPALRQPWDG